MDSDLSDEEWGQWCEGILQDGLDGDEAAGGLHEYTDEKHPLGLGRETCAAPAKAEDVVRKKNGDIVRPIRRSGPMELSRRQKLWRGVRGLGKEGDDKRALDITYHLGPIAARTDRKCTRNRNRNFKSGVVLDPDVEADRARVRAIALMEEVRLEKKESEKRREVSVITEIVIEECKEHGILVDAGEATARRTVEAVTAIARGTWALRRKWMIDSGCAMDLVSERELTQEEMALSKRVKSIKFNTANGGTCSDREIRFNIEPLLECVYLRILRSTPGVLSMGMRCMGQGYSFHWPAGRNPIFIRPDKEVVQLQVLGDIPYLTNARSTAEEYRDHDDIRILAAMPASTSLPSRWERKINSMRAKGDPDIEEQEGCSDDEISHELENIGEANELLNRGIVRASDQWGYSGNEIKRFHYCPRDTPFDPTETMEQEPWMGSVISRLASTRITYMKLADGRKYTIRDNWVTGRDKKKRSLAGQEVWTGKTYFKIMPEDQIDPRVEETVQAILRAKTEKCSDSENSKRQQSAQIMAKCTDSESISVRGDSQNLGADGQEKDIITMAAEEKHGHEQEPNDQHKDTTVAPGITDGEVHSEAVPALGNDANEMPEVDDDTDLFDMIVGEGDGPKERASGSKDRPDDAAGLDDPLLRELAEEIHDDFMSEERVKEGHVDENEDQEMPPLIIRKKKREEENRMKKRSGDRDEAHTTQHLLTHFPKNVHCVACRQSKVTNVRFTRRKKPREITEDQAKFGKRVTADTIVLRNAKDRGINGETNAIVFYDLFTGWIDCIPVRNRTTEETVRAVNQFKGPDDILGELYTDQAGEFSKACAIIGACNGTATPGMPRTNGIAESRVKEVLCGARVILRQAGLEAKWWPYAVKAYCLHKNMRESENEDTPYRMRHGDDDPGIKLMPLGCLVDMLPVADKPRKPREDVSDEQLAREEQAEEERGEVADEDTSSIAAPAVKAKFDPPTSPGLHLGYAQLPGGKPNGDYFVAEMAHLLHAWEKPSVHQTKRIVPPEKEEWYFPMERVYEYRTRLMTESRAQAIAQIEHDREKGYICEGPIFDEGREPKKDTKRRIEDDRKFIGEGDYWEHFPDEHKWVLHHIMLRKELVLPGDEALAEGGPGRQELDELRYTRMVTTSGNEEERWDDRWRCTVTPKTRWYGESCFWEKGFAPERPRKEARQRDITIRSRGVGLDYEQDTPRRERQYTGSAKPNIISSAEWNNLSVKQRKEFVEQDRKRILEGQQAAVAERNARKEETESWTQISKKTWMATKYQAERPADVPDHYEVWVRYDSDTRTSKGTHGRGPKTDWLWWRVTRNADTREILCSEPIIEGVGQEVLARRLSRAQDIVTELWYEKPSETGQPRDAAPCLHAESEEGDAHPEGGQWEAQSMGVVRVPTSWDGELKRRTWKEKKPCLIEFACEPDSRLADTVEKLGVEGVRVHEESYDILSADDMEELSRVIDEKHPDIWGALPCTMWSTWQYVNSSRGGAAFKDRLGGKREASKRMVAEYEHKADQVASKGGRQAFEWPRWCTGWKETRRWQYVADRDLWVVDFDGCMLGMTNERGQLVKKMWRVATDDPELAITLGMFRCRHPPGAHAKIAGQTTKATAFYPQAMCDLIAGIWYGAEREGAGLSSEGESCEGESSESASDVAREMPIPNSEADGAEKGVDTESSAIGQEGDMPEHMGATPAARTKEVQEDPIRDKSDHGSDETTLWDRALEAIRERTEKWKKQRMSKITAMDGGAYTVVGAYTHGANSGITNATDGSEDAIKRINEAMRKDKPNDTWGAITVMHTPEFNVHSDNHNAKGSSNHVRAIGTKDHVGIWVEDKDGPTKVHDSSAASGDRMGYVEPVSNTTVSFDPKRKHTVVTQARDFWLVTVYTPRGIGNLKATDVQRLRELGFPLPSAAGDVWEGSTPDVSDDERVPNETGRVDSALKQGGEDRVMAVTRTPKEDGGLPDAGSAIEEPPALSAETHDESSDSSWVEEEVVIDSSGPPKCRVMSWEPAMGGVTVSAPKGTVLKARRVNFVRTDVYLENPERFALNVVGIADWCAKYGTAVQGFDLDENDGTIIVHVDNRSNEDVQIGDDNEEAFRFIFSKRMVRLRPRARWMGEMEIKPTRKGKSRRVTRVSKGQLPLPPGGEYVGPTMETGLKLSEVAGSNAAGAAIDPQARAHVPGERQQVDDQPNDELDNQAAGSEIGTEDTGLQSEVSEIDDTVDESEMPRMKKRVTPPRLCRRRRCRECRNNSRGTGTVPYLALATATLCNMCFIQKHPVFADKVVKFITEDEESTDEGDSDQAGLTSSTDEWDGENPPREILAMPCFPTSDSDFPDEIFAMVARPVTKAERAVNPKARASLDKEWDKLESQRVWIVEEMRPWAEVQEEARRTGVVAHVGRIFDICVEKNHELPEDDPLRKYKGRVVFEGCNVKDQDNRWAIFQEITSCPATMEAGKMADAYGMMEGHTIQMADGESAYTQAELGGPRTWVRIPRERWPEEWEGETDPVCPLRLALYGHPDAGGFWEKHCEKAVTEVGFDFLPDWPSVFFHKELRLMLVIYVDDFKLAGPKSSMEEGWKLLSLKIKLEQARPIGRYLGCLHISSVHRVTGQFNPREEWMKDGSNKKDPPDLHEKCETKGDREIQVMKYDMSDFMRQCVIRYQELCGEAYPKPLEKAKTPYLDETKGEFDENPVDEKMNRVFGLDAYEVDTTPGVLKEHAPAVLMKILYGARVARYDLLRPVQALASKLTKWTKLCDKSLHRLVSYINQTADTCLFGWVGDSMDRVKLVLYCDADLASDRNDNKSTSGVYLALQGPSTFVPIAAYCRKQTSISKSTPEAEVVALHDGITKQGIPGLVLWEQLKGYHQKITVAEDNQAAVRIIISGKNPNMRYLSRTQRVDIARLNQFYSDSLFEFKDCPTEFQAANMMTKAISDGKEWHRDMCNTGHFEQEIMDKYLTGYVAAPASRGVSQNFGYLLGNRTGLELESLATQESIQRDDHGIQAKIYRDVMILYRNDELGEEPRISVADLPWQRAKGAFILVPKRRTGVPSQQKSRGSRDEKPSKEEQEDMDVIAGICKDLYDRVTIMAIRPDDAFMSSGVFKHVCESSGMSKPVLMHDVLGLERNRVANTTSIHMSASRHLVNRPLTLTHFRHRHDGYLRANCDNRTAGELGKILTGELRNIYTIIELFNDQVSAGNTSDNYTEVETFPML